MNLRTILAAVAALTMLAGCAVGPDFERPKLDADAGYLGTGDAKIGGAGGVAIAYGAEVPGRWALTAEGVRRP